MVTIRNNILEMEAYIPGEASDDPAAIKLNQNENRYPPSEKVGEAIRAAAGKLYLYPDSSSASLRQAAAEIYNVDEDEVMAANGSDEMLRLLIQAAAGPGDVILTFSPTYTYYDTLCAMLGVRIKRIPFAITGTEVALPDLADEDADKLSMIVFPNPNAPTGTVFSHDAIRKIALQFPGILVVVDEAYADFSGQTVIPLIRELPNLAVTRTFSKSYALAGLRIGLGFARREVLAQIEKIRDYYNLDRLAQAGAEAALRDQEWLITTTGKIAATRERTTKAVREMGVEVFPSGANFILINFASSDQADQVFAGLRQRNILVRRFKSALPAGIRVTIGTDPDMDAFLQGLKEILITR